MHQRLRNWLKTMVDVYAQLDNENPPFLAVYDVELVLPADVLAYLLEKEVIREKDGEMFFRYSQDCKVPVKCQRQ